MILHSIRAPSEYEKAIFRRLMEVDFPGRDILRQQLESCQVGTIDTEGSVRIHSAVQRRAQVRFRIPVEAYGKDSDGEMVSFLLHVVDGVVQELEILKGSSSRVISPPAPETLELIVYPIKG